MQHAQQLRRTPYPSYELPASLTSAAALSLPAVSVLAVPSSLFAAVVPVEVVAVAAAL